MDLIPLTGMPFLASVEEKAPVQGGIQKDLESCGRDGSCACCDLMGLGIVGGGWVWVVPRGGLPLVREEEGLTRGGSA